MKTSLSLLSVCLFAGAIGLNPRAVWAQEASDQGAQNEVSKDNPSPLSSVLQAVEKSLQEGSFIGVRYRDEHKNDGSLARDQSQYRIDLKINFQVLPNGKLKVGARILSGAKYDSGWDETGIGRNKVDGEFNTGLRALYLDYSPTENMNIAAGAIPIWPSGINAKGVLAMDGDGWVDGARVSYAGLAKWADRIAVTVGQVDEYRETNALSREWGSPNFMQVHVQGNITERVRQITEYTKLEENQYVRFVAEVMVKDILSFADSVVLEDLIMFGEGDSHQGFAATIKKSIGSWKMAGSYSYKGRSISKSGEGYLLLEDAYRAGHQVTFLVERPTRWGSSYFQVGKNLGASKFGSNHGMRAEGGIKINVGKRKKGKKK